MGSVALAIAFTAMLGVLSIFQLALAFGAPLGKFAWGGAHERTVPASKRIASAFTVLIYAAFAALALDRAGVIDVVPDAVSRIGMWIVCAVLVLSAVMNLLSKSRQERFVMAPVAIILAILAMAVTVQGASGPGITGQGQHRQVGTFTVIGDDSDSDSVNGAGTGAMLCDGAIMESYPPQCKGERITHWDWDAVDHYEEVGSVRFGEYDLAVMPDGAGVHVTVAQAIDAASDGESQGDPQDMFVPTVTWIDEGRTFELVTYGSSSCPSVVSKAEVIHRDQMVLRLAQSGGEVCTADYGPHEEQVQLPAGVTERPVKVFLDFWAPVAGVDSLATLTLP